jgi:DNA invertase Pin-like site-specific DNA recombinase
MGTVYGYCVLTGPDQRRTLEEFCAERGCVLARVFEDPGELRDTGWFARPGVRALMSLLEPDDEVVVAGLRSIYASRRDLLKVFREHHARGVVLHIAGFSAKFPKSVTLGGAWGDMVLRSFEVFFEFDARARGEAIREALNRKRLEGRRYTCHLPPGWRWEGRRGQQRPVPDPYERAIIAKIIEWRDQGQSWNRIATHLLRSRVVTPAGREWSPSRARRVYVAATRGRSRPDT